ncbi:hypothetical protein T10_9922 [Trichinella papuae]|uniref:Uncharacterized protein n=1 Tax=Trichinella papuae TaxID=268474 RepID=A0A0V1MSY6_9BILA|nr:hypothetical protein T10_9922 [Trichinella papuae]
MKNGTSLIEEYWFKKHFYSSCVSLLRQESLNFGNVRSDAQQKLKTQSPLARSNQVKGDYLLLAVNYEAKLLVSLMLLLTAALSFAFNLAVSIKFESKIHLNKNDDDDDDDELAFCLKVACSTLANLTKFMRVYQPSAAAPLQSLMPKIADPAYASYS